MKTLWSSSHSETCSGCCDPGCPHPGLSHCSSFSLRNLLPQVSSGWPHFIQVSVQMFSENLALIIPGKAGHTPPPIPTNFLICYQLSPLQSKSMKTGMVSSFCSLVIFLASRVAPGTYRSILNKWGNEGTGKQRSIWLCLGYFLENIHNVLLRDHLVKTNQGSQTRMETQAFQGEETKDTEVSE